MSKLQEVVTEHAHHAKLLHFLSKHYKSLTQGASFHRVTRLCYSEHLLHIPDNSQVDRTFLLIFVYFNYFLYKSCYCTILISKEQLVRLCLTYCRDIFRAIYRYLQILTRFSEFVPICLYQNVIQRGLLPNKDTSFTHQNSFTSLIQPGLY